MADDNNHQPEETFKDKILRSLHANDDEIFRNFQDKSNQTGENTGDQSANADLPTRSQRYGHQENSNSQRPVHQDFTYLSDAERRQAFTEPEPTVTEEPVQPVVPEETAMAEEPFTSVETEPEAVVNSTVEAGFETEQTAIPEATTKEKISYGEVKRQKRQKEDKVTRKIVFFVVSALVIVGLVLGLTFWSYVQSGLKPLDTDNKQLVQVEIPSGSSNKEIGEILENDKVIKSGMVFHFYTKFNNLTDFQAGYYQMAPNMSLDDISQLLQSGGTAEPVDIADAKITIPEGYDISQIASSIEEATTKKIKAADVKALMNDDAFFQEMLGKYPQLLTSVSQAEGLRYRLEGYLFPATYDYYAATSTLKGLVEQMIAKSDAVLQSYYEQIQNQGYTVQEVLTLASLVEKEGVEDADRRKIAQVFLNRLAQQMPLQSDISILYALDTHKEFVTLEDLEVDSPYNLYKNQGYGPGPFNNPSENAIQAVLNPEPNDYLYFVADVETGQVYFTGTYEEHMELVEKYVDNKKNE